MGGDKTKGLYVPPEKTAPPPSAHTQVNYRSGRQVLETTAAVRKLVPVRSPSQCTFLSAVSLSEGWNICVWCAEGWLRVPLLVSWEALVVCV